MTAKINPSYNWKIKIKPVLCFRWDCLTSHKAETPRLWQVPQVRLPFDPRAGGGPAGPAVPSAQALTDSEGWCACEVTR